LLRYQLHMLHLFLMTLHPLPCFTTSLHFLAPTPLHLPSLTASLPSALFPCRCIQFVEHNLDALRSEPHMRQCLAMHLLMLWDFALMDGASMDRCLQLYDGPMAQLAQ
jgi:hypothetical protein